MNWNRSISRAKRILAPAPVVAADVAKPTAFGVAWAFTPDRKLDNIITILDQSRWVMG